MTVRRLLLPWWFAAVLWLVSAWLYLADKRMAAAFVLAAASLVVVVVMWVMLLKPTTTTTTTTRQSTVRRGAYARWRKSRV